jgi:hypothetical protein
MKHLNTLKLVAAAALLPLAGTFAADGDVTASASFRVVLTVTQTQAFHTNAVGPKIEYTGTPDTSELRVFTDGSRAATGAFYVIPGTGNATAGVLRVTATPAETINIACDDTATLAETGGGTIILSALEIDTTGGVAGNATDCDAAGLTNPVVPALAIGGGGTQDIQIGGRIVANSGSGVGGFVYSTSNAGGNPITLRVLYN